MGSLVKIVLWSTTACIRASQPPARTCIHSFVSFSTSPIHPHTSLLSICLHLSHSPRPSAHFALSRFLAVLIRFTFAMLFARPLHHTLSLPIDRTQTCLTGPVLFLIYRPLVLFCFFLPLLVSRNFRISLLGAFLGLGLA